MTMTEPPVTWTAEEVRETLSQLAQGEEDGSLDNRPQLVKAAVEQLTAFADTLERSHTEEAIPDAKGEDEK